MSSLEALFAAKLASRLPGASLCANPAAGDTKTMPASLEFMLASEDAQVLTVSLPAKTYSTWTRPVVQLLLEEILAGCELQLKLSRQQARYQGYLEEVKSTKEKLLPHPTYRIEGVEYAVHYAPSIGGGGDYFDIVDLRDARRRAGVDSPDIFWGFSLFDVSGHGPGAAVEVAMIDAILRTYQGGPGKGPGDVLTYINRHFFTRQGRGGFVTGIICNYDAATNEFLYANAGHLPLLIKRGDGSLVVLDDHQGIPIGIDRESQWETLSFSLASGDTLLMLTDGITEARSETKQEFGLETVQALLTDNDFIDPGEFMQIFTQRFIRHMGKSPAQDDQTLIAIRLTH